MARQRVSPTIQAVDEPESTIYVLTRADGTRLCHHWPDPLLELEPNAKWVSQQTYDIGSNYAIDAYVRDLRPASRVKREERQKPTLPSVQGQVQPRQQDELLQDLWPDGRDRSSGAEGSPEVEDWEGLGEEPDRNLNPA